MGSVTLPNGYEHRDQFIHHVRTNVYLSRTPILVTADGLPPELVLFHYCNRENFENITRSGRMVVSTVSLADRDFGVGIYGTEKPPDAFNDILQILCNSNPSRARSRRFPPS